MTGIPPELEQTIRAIDLAFSPGESEDKAVSTDWLRTNPGLLDRLVQILMGIGAPPPDNVRQVCYQRMEKFQSEEALIFFGLNFQGLEAITKAFACKIFATRIKMYYNSMSDGVKVGIAEILFGVINPESLQTLLRDHKEEAPKAQAVLGFYGYQEIPILSEMWPKVFAYEPSVVMVFIAEFFRLACEPEPQQAYCSGQIKKVLVEQDIAQGIQQKLLEWWSLQLPEKDRQWCLKALTGFLRIAPAPLIGFAYDPNFLQTLQSSSADLRLLFYLALVLRASPDFFMSDVGRSLDQIIRTACNETRPETWNAGALLTATVGTVIIDFQADQALLGTFWDFAMNFISSDNPPDARGERLTALNAFITRVVTLFQGDNGIPIVEGLFGAVFRRLQSIWSQDRGPAADILMKKLASLIREAFRVHRDVAQGIIQKWVEEAGLVTENIPLSTAVLALLYHLLDQNALVHDDFAINCFRAFEVFESPEYFRQERISLYYYLISAGRKVFARVLQGNPQNREYLGHVRGLFDIALSLSTGRERGEQVCRYFAAALESFVEDLGARIEASETTINQILSLPIVELHTSAARLLMCIPDVNVRMETIHRYFMGLVEAVGSVSEDMKLATGWNALHFAIEVKAANQEFANALWDGINRVKELLSAVPNVDPQELEIMVILAVRGMGPWGIFVLDGFLRRGWDEKSTGAIMSVLHSLFLAQKENNTGDVKKQLESPEWKRAALEVMREPVYRSVMFLKYSDKTSRNFKLFALPIVQGWHDIIAKFFKDEKKPVDPGLNDWMGQIATISTRLLQQLYTQPDLLVIAMDIFLLIAIRFPQQMVTPGNFLALHGCLFSPEFDVWAPDGGKILEKLMEVNQQLLTKCPDVWRAAVQALVSIFEVPGEILAKYGEWETSTAKYPVFVEIISKLMLAKARNVIASA